MLNFIPENNKKDIEKTGYVTVNNFAFANQIWFKNICFGFYFPVSLQNHEFFFSKISIEENTGEISIESNIFIDENYKEIGYFQTHKLDSDLTAGFYIIRAIDISGNYNTSSIFEVKNQDFSYNIEIINKFIDATGDSFIDAAGDSFVEKK